MHVPRYMYNTTFQNSIMALMFVCPLQTTWLPFHRAVQVKSVTKSGLSFYEKKSLFAVNTLDIDWLDIFSSTSKYTSAHKICSQYTTL